MWKYLGVVIGAVLLSAVTPLLVAADNGLVLRTWFQWLPLELHLMLLPDTELMLAALAMLALAVPYLMVFLLLTPLRPLLRRLGKAMLRPVRRALTGRAPQSATQP